MKVLVCIAILDIFYFPKPIAKFPKSNLIRHKFLVTSDQDKYPTVIKLKKGF